MYRYAAKSPDLAACAGNKAATVMRRVLGPVLTLERMLRAQAEATLQESPDELHEKLPSRGPAMFMEAGRRCS